jgi:hypothetical protein
VRLCTTVAPSHRSARIPRVGASSTAPDDRDRTLAGRDRSRATATHVARRPRDVSARRRLRFSPLSRGLLADDLDPARTFGSDDERHFLPRYQSAIYQDYVGLARRPQDWAEARGKTLTRLAIAWTLANSGVTATLVGAKSAAQVQALSGADGWRLDAGDS